MPRIATVVHAGRREAMLLADQARSWWEVRGYEVVDLVAAGDDTEKIELALSLGGDGTMLRTVELASPHGIPVLGVNIGHLGYLTEVDPPGIEEAFARVLAGDYTLDERMTLEVRIERAPGSDAESESFVALNEAVVEKLGPGHTIRLEVDIAGHRFLSYVADGIIVSTPTGSTAYNLSARGPIVSPSLRAMVLTPISPHMLFDRSLVLDPEEWVRLRLGEGPPAALACDGSIPAQIAPGDSVICRASGTPVRLVSLGPRDFHAILRGKFGLADR